MEACERSRHDIAENFISVDKMVEMPIKPRKDGQIGFAGVGKTKTKTIKDYKLTRYA